MFFFYTINFETTWQYWDCTVLSFSTRKYSALHHQNVIVYRAFWPRRFDSTNLWTCGIRLSRLTLKHPVYSPFYKTTGCQPTGARDIPMLLPELAHCYDERKWKNKQTAWWSYIENLEDDDILMSMFVYERGYYANENIWNLVLSVMYNTGHSLLIRLHSKLLSFEMM